MLPLFSLGTLLAAALLSGASPASHFSRSSDATPVALSEDQISAYTPFAWYSAAAYCPTESIIHWDCGEKCDANPHFVPVSGGGDGAAVPYYYVGYDPLQDSVIVVHQGTNLSHITPILTDANLIRTHMNSAFFPDLPSDMTVHQGIQGAWAKSASAVLEAVQHTMDKYSTKSVIITGHSLGAAIALLDSIYLPLNLPSDTEFTTYIYGLPRIGNAAFATYVSENVNLTFFTNKRDPFPVMPSRSLGFMQPIGEVHIDYETSVWHKCPLQEDQSDLCSDGDVPSLLVSNFKSHFGPYGRTQDGKDLMLGLAC